jgi:thiol:disulfide interchange protein
MMFKPRMNSQITLARYMNMTGNDRLTISRLARRTLVAFLFTFMLARIVVFLIMSRRIPNLYLHSGGTHIHHLNYGIFLLAAVGGGLLFWDPGERGRKVLAVLYGIGMALTFDEFGMWIHLGGSYWQRASWDAVTVVAAAFSLMAFAPSLKRFSSRHWKIAITLSVVSVIFFLLLAESFQYVGKAVSPTLHKIETEGPT